MTIQYSVYEDMSFATEYVENR